MMEDLKASSREEALLAKIAGLDDPFADSIQPSSREEWFLNKIAEKTNSGSSGGGAFIVRGTLNEGSSTDGTVDKTEAEIWDAVNSWKTVYFYLPGAEAGAGEAFYSFSQASKIPFSDTSFFVIVFGGIGLDAAVTIVIAQGSFHIEEYPLSSS